MIASPGMRPTRTRTGTTYDVTIAGLDIRLTITNLPNGQPGEVFLIAGKQGSPLAGLCEALSLMTSLALQHHTPLTDITTRLAAMRFEPAGPTNDPDIPTVTSLADYLPRRLTLDYPVRDSD